MGVLAVYVFRDANTADGALDQLWRRLSGGFERSAGGEIWISSNCSDPNLAAHICMSCGGVLK